jgi:HEAT repeat protein
VLIAAVIVAAASLGLWWLLDAPRGRGDGGTPGGGTPAHGPPPESPRELSLRASAECRACHPEVWDEWASSHHAIAYTNPEVQKLSRNFRDRDCLPCHASRPVFETGLGNRVLEREVRLEEGVDCFTCHQFKNAMLGSPERLDGGSRAPCNPLPYAGIRDLGLCSPCHDQHKVMQDWLATEYATGPARKDCLDCHMPAAGRRATAERAAYVGRSHRFPAAHDPAMLRQALATSARVDERTGRLLIEVTNVGAGHAMPADERHRAVDLVVTLRDGAGNAATARVDRYRNPYRDEFHLRNPLRAPGAEHAYPVEFGAIGRADVVARRVPPAFNPERRVHYPESTQIPAGEARAYAIAVPEAARAATVRVIYKLNPFVADEGGTLLFEQEVDLGGARPGPATSAAPEPVRAPAGLGGAVERAEALLADARTRGAAAIPDLLLAMKDRSHSAFVLVRDPRAPHGLRVEENPHGGEDTRALERVAAIVALAELGTPQAVPELLLALDDRDGLPALHAAAALVAFGNRAGVPVLLAALERRVYENETANRLLMKLSGMDFGFDSDSGLGARFEASARWRAWWDAFQQSGEKLAGEGPPYRRGADADADRRIARYVDVTGEFQFLYMEQARRMLRRFGPPAVPFLEDGVTRAAGAERATWRGEIAHVLGGIAAPDAHRALAGLASDPHPAVRARALDALVAGAAPDAAVRARSALGDPDPSVVLAAIRGLARAGAPADAPLLASLARTEPELRVEIDVARLVLARSPETFDAVTRHLFDPSIAVRTTTLVALNALAGRAVLDDPSASEDARKSAIDAWRAAILR